MKKILFVCVHNEGRSQMAEAFFNYYAKDKAQASSAGTHYASHINPTVIEAMKEAGIDISNKRPKMMTLEMLGVADKVITMGCGVEGVCPASFVPTEDWQLEDPEGKPIEKVRAIRDEIETKVKKLIEDIPENPDLAQHNKIETR
jgi:arsenate reductase (thioredoxin)